MTEGEFGAPVIGCKLARGFEYRYFICHFSWRVFWEQEWSNDQRLSQSWWILQQLYYWSAWGRPLILSLPPCLLCFCPWPFDKTRRSYTTYCELSLSLSVAVLTSHGRHIPLKFFHFIDSLQLLLPTDWLIDWLIDWLTRGSPMHRALPSLIHV